MRDDLNVRSEQCCKASLRRQFCHALLQCHAINVEVSLQLDHPAVRLLPGYQLGIQAIDLIAQSIRLAAFRRGLRLQGPHDAVCFGALIAV